MRQAEGAAVGDSEQSTQAALHVALAQPALLAGYLSGAQAVLSNHYRDRFAVTAAFGKSKVCKGRSI